MVDRAVEVGALRHRAGRRPGGGPRPRSSTCCGTGTAGSRSSATTRRFATARDRLAGYRDVLAEHGIEPDSGAAPPDPGRPTPTPCGCWRGCWPLPDPPTAVFAANPRAGSRMAYALHIAEPRRAGVRQLRRLPAVPVAAPAGDLCGPRSAGDRAGGDAAGAGAAWAGRPGRRATSSCDTVLVPRGSGEIRTIEVSSMKPVQLSPEPDRPLLPGRREDRGAARAAGGRGAAARGVDRGHRQPVRRGRHRPGQHRRRRAAARPGRRRPGRLGRAPAAGRFTPGDTGMLVKLLDAGQRLPVHVHPDREFARSHLRLPVRQDRGLAGARRRPGLRGVPGLARRRRPGRAGGPPGRPGRRLDAGADAPHRGVAAATASWCRPARCTPSARACSCWRPRSRPTSRSCWSGR